MSGRYRLVFRGELLQGQHPAVVRKRLGQALKIDGERLGMLFSGKVVMLKGDADAATAARYQGLFKKSGARLEVHPVAGAVSASQPPPSTGSDCAPESAAGNAANAARADGGPQPDVGMPELMPPGSDLLRSDERRIAQPVKVDTSHLEILGAHFAVPESSAQVAVPDVSHLSLAEVGTALGLGPGPIVAPIALEELDFELAEVGADMNQIKREVAPPAPDVSHISLASGDDA